jgi:AP-3 complex subunit mu
VTLAPSGRPLSAFANGTIAFTSKVSGVPDMTMTLTGPSGNKHNLFSIIELPVFHPCVRLNRWRERPGELSFVPPDGRFILAGYEVDLLPFTNGKSGSLGSNALKLPVSLDVKTGLGTNGADFEVRLQLNRNFSPGGGQFGMAQQHGRSTSNTGGVGGGLSALTSSAPKAGTAAAPLLEDLSVTIPLPAEVRNLSEIRPTKGDAAYSPGDRFLEWHISNKELGSGGTSFFGLRCTVVGQLGDEDVGGPHEDEEAANMGLSGFAAYDDTPYQAADEEKQEDKKESRSARNGNGTRESQTIDEDAQAVARNKALMPSSASLSFAVKGWLPSGIKVESILIDTRKSRGLAEAVKPYKGVKYLAVSKRGVEIRC